MSNEELQTKFRDIYVMNAMNIMKCLEDLSEIKEEYESSDIFKKTGIGIYEMFNYYVKNDLFFEKLTLEIKQLFNDIDLEKMVNYDALEINNLVSQLNPESKEIINALLDNLL